MDLLQHSVSSPSCSQLPAKAPVIRRPANCLSMALSAHTSSPLSSIQPTKIHRLVMQSANSLFLPRCQHPSSISGSAEPEEKPPDLRRRGNFHRTLWDDQFIESLTTYDEETISSLTRRVVELKDKVQYTFSHSSNCLEKMNLIDTIERLGLDYHFEREIEETLKQLYEDGDVDDNLHDVALRFRLLRQQGYNVPCDVFEKFKDKDGTLEQILKNDVKGLLSLYEASQHRIHGEDILDEALAFTRVQLRSMCANLDPSIVRHVEHALTFPLHKTITRIGIRHYISFYEADESRNDVLLELAKLEFNLLQSLHQSEIKEVTKWRKDMDFTVKLPFATDRVVELYLWALGMHYLPQFSEGRIKLAKFLNLLPLVEDTYDVYGTLDELELYTEALNRWDIEAIYQLPEYMKLSYLAVFNLFNKIEYMSLYNRGSSGISHLRKTWEDQCKGYMQEVRWFNNNYVPSMDEYLKVGSSTSCAFVLPVITALGMGEMVTNEALDYIVGGSKFPWLLSLVSRFTDDLGTSKDEHARGDVARSIQCYMKEQGASEEVARIHIKNMNEETWKDINQELLKPLPLPKPLVKAMVNLIRMCETFYLNENDGLGNSELWMVNLVNSLFFDPIPM